MYIEINVIGDIEVSQGMYDYHEHIIETFKVVFKRDVLSGLPIGHNYICTLEYYPEQERFKYIASTHNADVLILPKLAICSTTVKRYLMS